MDKKLFKRGFNAVEEEEQRREEAREKRKSMLWRLFFGKNDKEIPWAFITEEPVCFYEHNVKRGANFDPVTCSVDDCEDCERGDRPTYKAAWLGVDKRSFKTKGKDGKEVTRNGSVKLLVRGMRDAGVLAQKKSKFGLLGRTFDITKTGSGQQTVWQYERSDSPIMSKKEIDKWLATLPEELQKMTPDEIVEFQIEHNMRVNAIEDDDEEDDAPPPKRGKKAKEVEEEIEDDIEEDEDDDVEEDEEPAPKKRTFKKKEEPPKKNPPRKRLMRK